MPRVMRLGAAKQLAVRALGNGGIRRSLSLVTWDISSNCERPVVWEVEGRPDTRRGEVGMPIAIHLEMRCRRCPTCLRRRAWEWRTRMNAEIASSSRTWFGTLTLTPEAHYVSELRAQANLRARGTDLEKLSPDEQFKERVTAISAEITLWLKRCRKVSGAKLRYCLVAEAHKSGLPHLVRLRA